MLRRIQAACAFHLAICLIAIASLSEIAVSLPAYADAKLREKPAKSKELSGQEIVDVTDLTQSDGPFSIFSFAPKPGRFRMKVTKGWTLKLPYTAEVGTVAWMLFNNQQVGAPAGSKTPDNREWRQLFPAHDPVLEVSGGDGNALLLFALRKGTATLQYIAGDEANDDNVDLFKKCELQIVVESDTSEIDQAIKSAVPQAQVRVIEIRDTGAVLVGTTTTEDDARVILQIGKQFYEEVIPQLKVVPATAESKVQNDSRTRKKKSNKNKRSEKPDVSEMKQLRNEVKSLRDEVRHLSELMEQSEALSRTVPVPFHETQPPELPHHDDPATDAEKNHGVTQAPIVNEPSNEKGRSTNLKKPNEALFFTAAWCAPCKKMVPLITKLKKQGLPIRVIDIDEEKQMEYKYKIEIIPSLILTFDGEEVKRIAGLQDEKAVNKLLQDLRQTAPKND